jgi:hypothetical protein
MLGQIWELFMSQVNLQTNRFFKRRWIVAGGLVVMLISAVGFWLARAQVFSQSAEAPEASKVLVVQEKMPFRILIPAYLPEAFDRAGVEVDIQQSSPSGEPMVQLTYHSSQGAVLFVHQWLPTNPKKEILASSFPVDTRWGDGYMLTQEESLIAIWADVGPLRVSVFSSNTEVLSTEQILEVANSLGPTSNEQVFAYLMATPSNSKISMPMPVEIQPDAQGVQELTMVITPGGYSPMRFSVKKGLPVRLVFRQLGQVGSGKELIFPTGPENTAYLRLKNEGDQQVLEFTPQTAGDFTFHCSRNLYQGVMTVRP